MRTKTILTLTLVFMAGILFAQSQLGPLTIKYWNNAQKAEQAGDYETAIREYNKILKSVPGFINTYYQLGNIAYEHKNDIDEAIDWYKRSISIAETSFVYLQLGIFYLNKASTDEQGHEDLTKTAQVYFEKCIKSRNPDQESEISVQRNHASAWYNLCIIYINLKDYEKAENAAKQAMQERDYEETMRQQLISIYALSGNYDKALADINVQLKRSPNDLAIRKLKLNILHAMNASETDILAEMKELERLGTDDPSVISWLGQEALNKKEYQKAYDYFAKLVQTDRNNAIGHIGMGKALLMMGKKQDGLKKMQEAEQYVTADAALLIHIADAYQEVGDFKKSIDYYSRIIMLNPNDYASYHNLANAYLKSDPPNLAQAIINYKKAVQLNKDSYASLIGLFYAYYGNKQHKDAYEMGKQIQRIKKDSDVERIIKNIEESGVLKN